MVELSAVPLKTLSPCVFGRNDDSGRPGDSEAERRAALPGWLHFYNHDRTHSVIGGPPVSRLNNLPGITTSPKVY